MSDCQNQNDQQIFPDFTEDAVVSDPVSPQTAKFTLEWLTEMPGILAAFKAIIEPIYEPLLHGPVELAQLLLGEVADFNCPGQALSSSQPTISWN
jgi:hypothetical protein